VEGVVSHEIDYEATVLRDTILQVLDIDIILRVVIKSRRACQTGADEASAKMRSMIRYLMAALLSMLILLAEVENFKGHAQGFHLVRIQCR